MDRSDRASRRFGGRHDDTKDKKPAPKAGADDAPRGEKKAEAEAGKTASGKGAPHAEPGNDAKTVDMKPNAEGAEAVGADAHAQMTERHSAELEAMQGRHQQEFKDMHGRHMDEMKQMHGRHAEEIGNGAGATATEGPKLDDKKRKWKTVDKGKGGSEPKGD